MCLNADATKIAPTILSNVTTSMKCYQEEIFGPVLVCLNVETLDEAIDLINSNRYGNGVAVFTNSGATATKFQRNIEAGQVGINTPIPGKLLCYDEAIKTNTLPVPLPMFSFTGNKGSIAGQSGHYFYGKSGINFYTQLKTVTSYVHLLYPRDRVMRRSNDNYLAPTLGEHGLIELFQAVEKRGCDCEQSIDLYAYALIDDHALGEVSGAICNTRRMPFGFLGGYAVVFFGLSLWAAFRFSECFSINLITYHRKPLVPCGPVKPDLVIKPCLGCGGLQGTFSECGVGSYARFYRERASSFSQDGHAHASQPSGAGSSQARRR